MFLHVLVFISDLSKGKIKIIVSCSGSIAVIAFVRQYFQTFSHVKLLRRSNHIICKASLSCKNDSLCWRSQQTRPQTTLLLFNGYTTYILKAEAQPYLGLSPEILLFVKICLSIFPFDVWNKISVPDCYLENSSSPGCRWLCL